MIHHCHSKKYFYTYILFSLQCTIKQGEAKVVTRRTFACWLFFDWLESLEMQQKYNKMFLNFDKNSQQWPQYLTAK